MQAALRGPGEFADATGSRFDGAPKPFNSTAKNPKGLPSRHPSAARIPQKIAPRNLAPLPHTAKYNAVGQRRSSITDPQSQHPLQADGRPSGGRLGPLHLPSREIEAGITMEQQFARSEKAIKSLWQKLNVPNEGMVLMSLAQCRGSWAQTHGAEVCRRDIPM